ncbi:mitochondrial dicarboxylate transporter-like, partial [Scaptodrosophila lebanonensis]|uniref:Mitochondrial dicarboxylate transporter-like n=1 Tax=Drosophila lebanonensis TaxID=7225 RepID=A0A6J2T384_DROLE
MTTQGTYETLSNVPAYLVYLINLTGTVLAHPMDVMRVNVQASALHYISLRRIIRLMFNKKGIRGFYYGLEGAIVRCTVQSISQYMFFHYLKHSQYITILKPFDNNAVAGLSGFCSGMLATPFVKYAMIRQTDLTRNVYDRRNYVNFANACFCMFHKGGIKHIFAGFKLHALTSCALAVATPPIYNTIQDLLVKLHKLDDKPWEISLISLTLTGSILSLIFTPVDAIKTIIMTADYEVYPMKKDVCAALIQRHGYKGFFLGLKPALAAIIPHSIVA